MKKILGWMQVIVLAAGLSVVAFATVAADQASRDVLVLGGTGKVGARVVRALVNDGHRVTVFMRPTSDRSRIKGLPVSYVVGDLMNEADISAAMSGRQFNIIISASSGLRIRVPVRRFSEQAASLIRLFAMPESTLMKHLLPAPPNLPKTIPC